MALVTTDYEEYSSPLTGEMIKLNSSSSEFCILEKAGSIKLDELVTEYLNVKWQVTWDELMEVVETSKDNPRGKENSKYIKMLISSKDQTLYVRSGFIKSAFNVSSVRQLFKKIDEFSIEQQREIVNKLKPKNTAEAEEIFAKRYNVDFTGSSTIAPLIQSCKSTIELLTKLIGIILEHIYALNLKSGRITNSKIRNYLELLALLHSKGAFLYPCIFKSSDLPLHQFLLHKNNVCYYFGERFADKDAYGFVKMIESTGVSSSLAKLVSDARCLVMATTLRSCNQLSDPLLDKLIEINESIDEGKSIGIARSTSARYTGFVNTLIGIYNAGHDNLALKLRPRRKNKKFKLSQEEHSDLSYISKQRPELTWWPSVLQSYCLSSKDSQYAPRVAACKAFAGWLLNTKNPPENAFKIVRSLHINDYADGNTFRNYLKNKFSLASVNTHLTLMRQFFDFAHDVMLREYADNPSLMGNYTNPIDPKFDSFKEQRNVGTKRVPIEARIMEVMRSVIIENDYEFPKRHFTFCYAPLTNHALNQFEPSVFCPSIANLLYFMLWIPVRKIQAQLLDSGEGDKYIFDFDTRTMKPNAHPYAGKENRSEGVLRLLPSGVLGINDIVGLHITTNKSQADGYDVPWVNDELISSLRNQRKWLSQYSPQPEPRGRESLGKLVGKEIELNGSKFYSLFRDPTAEKLDDPYAPASAHRIKWAWGLVCKEAERRINEEEIESPQKVKLVTDDKGRYPTSRYDIHTLRVSGITDLLEKGVPLGIVQKFVAGHATYFMTLWYDNPSHFKVREYLEAARKSSAAHANFSFGDHQFDDVKEFFVVNESYLADGYSPYDVLEKNSGIISIKLSGICPGGSCEEGGISTYGDRTAPVPAGDRGPSCPQCRFWITGPMFLLGQVIEGNQLIRKIKKKVSAIDKIRESILDAEDEGNTGLVNTLTGREDREMRILSNMITEWYERMKFYEASISKLDEWTKYSEALGTGNSQLALLTKSSESEIKYGFENGTELELTHFISTVAEFFPEFIDSDDTSVLDLEQAISRFVALNDVGDLLFKLSDKQRIAASNMITNLLIDSVGPHNAERLLDGDLPLHHYPELSGRIAKMLSVAKEKSFKIHSNIESGTLHGADN